eukprot:1140981-Pelagomonas_calceolata.AAC.1
MGSIGGLVGRRHIDLFADLEQLFWSVAEIQPGSARKLLLRVGTPPTFSIVNAQAWDSPNACFPSALEGLHASVPTMFLLVMIAVTSVGFCALTLAGSAAAYYICRIMCVAGSAGLAAGLAAAYFIN